jgi:hypothetical protein
VAAKNPAAETFVDFISSAEAGMNSGVSPLLLQKNQIGFGLNTSLRGGFLKTRPPIRKQTLNYAGNASIQAIVESGLFQGAGYYRPDYGPESLLAQIAGHLILFTEIGSSWLVTDVSVPNDFNDPTVNQVWMWQSEKWMIISDGTGAMPIFFNGTTSRRSNGFSVQLGTLQAAFTPPIPRVIGEIDTLTLTAPFTGNYNLPVIFNGEFYQPLQLYKVSLKNVSDTAGNAVAQGTQAIVNPSKAGFLNADLLAGSLVGGCIPAGRVYLPTYVSNLLLPITPGAITLLDTNGNGRTFFLSAAGKISAPNQICFTGNQTKTWPHGQVITYTNASLPNTILGKFVVGFAAPAVGASITVNLDTPYTGASNQPVWINGQQYLITLVVVPPIPSNILNLIDLTDLKTTPVPIGAIVVSVPELPPGRMGAYGMGCNSESLVDGISYIEGDVVGGGSGTPAENYRDAVLKITQNTFLRGGGVFRLPGAGEVITAMWFPPVLDNSLGQGPLEIGTASSIWSNNVPGTDPINWVTVTFPIQSETLKDKGPLGQNSTILMNSDTFFRSYDGISTLLLARRDFTEWGNKPISNEMQRVLKNDIQSLLVYGSAMVSDNRYVSTAAPNVSGRGVFHMALISLNCDLLSSFRTTLPPSWEAMWTGINALQLLTGRVNGSKRAFAFTFNINLNTTELYEFLPEITASYMDNDVTPIVWAFETAVTFGQDIKPLTELVQLHDGEVYLSDIKDEVTVKVYYRPDYYPCWTLWREFTVCQSNDAANSKPGYRMRIGLGEPSPDPCEVGNNRPLRLGYFFQYRVEITGSCIWKGLRASAIAMPQPAFAPVECDEHQCQVIDCDLPDDLRIYSLQGLPPQPLLPVVRPPLFLSEQVEYAVPGCIPGGTLTYTGVLPTWITIDPNNPCNLIGAAGTFSGPTQEEANALAAGGLAKFPVVVVPPYQFDCEGNPTDVNLLVWTDYGSSLSDSGHFDYGYGATTADWSRANNFSASGANGSIGASLTLTPNPIETESFGSYAQGSDATWVCYLCNPGAARTLRITFTNIVDGGGQLGVRINSVDPVDNQYFNVSNPQFDFALGAGSINYIIISANMVCSVHYHWASSAPSPGFQWYDFPVPCSGNISADFTLTLI